MRARILIDNISQNGLISEWGLSVWIEHEGQKILLDAGTSGRFVQNARAMGISLEDVDIGVLSHAHFDHANGIEAFFAVNQKAKFYLRAGTKENCYGKKGIFSRYIGPRRGMMVRHAGRFAYADGKFALMPGVWLLPHSTQGLEKIAARSGLYVRRGLRLVPDNFAHEQSLVLETDAGLVIFNSCSHAGPDNIIAEVESAFPGRKIHALIGGLHLYRLTDAEVRALADRIRQTGIERVLTGHCTGDRAYAVLREELGDMVQQLYTGMEIEV